MANRKQVTKPASTGGNQGQGQAKKAATKPTAVPAKARPNADQMREATVAEIPRTAPTPSKDAPTKQWLENQLRATLAEGKREVQGLRRRQRITYWILVAASAVLFLIGLVLIAVPAREFYRDDIDEMTFGFLAGSGAVLLGLLLYFRPLERLQTLAGDAAYVSMVKDSFQYQVMLRLLAVQEGDPETIANAAGQVAEAAQASMDLVYTQLQARRVSGIGS
jgi:hypothetical protein